MKKIGVIGARGFIGSHLVRHFSALGFEVTSFSHAPENSNLGSNDYMDISLMTKRFQKIDVLINAAWIGLEQANRDNWGVQSRNVEINKSLLAAVTKATVNHYICLGSQDEFGLSITPWGDDDSLSPQSSYAKAKCEVLGCVEGSELPTTWARIFSTYGIGDLRNSVFLKVLRALKYQTPLELGGCEQMWTNLHISDLSRGIEKIISESIFGRVNVADDYSKSLRDQLEMMIQISGKENLITFNDNGAKYRNIESKSGKLKKTGWLPKVTYEEGFAELLEWSMQDSHV